MGKESEKREGNHLCLFLIYSFFILFLSIIFFFLFLSFPLIFYSLPLVLCISLGLPSSLFTLLRHPLFSLVLIFIKIFFLFWFSGLTNFLFSLSSTFSLILPHSLPFSLPLYPWFTLNESLSLSLSLQIFIFHLPHLFSLSLSIFLSVIFSMIVNLDCQPLPKNIRNNCFSCSSFPGFIIKYLSSFSILVLY